jgi:hypothetical protein
MEIMAPLARRRLKSRIFRPGDLIDAERQFRALPSAGRLSLRIDRDKHGLKIEELRCAAGKIRFAEWAGDAADPDIGVMKIELQAVSWGQCFVAGDLVASLSLHALGRRFQRGFRTDDESILSEFRSMARCHPDIIQTPGDFSIPGDGGLWVGEIGLRDAMPVMAIRSFKPGGAAVTGTAYGMVAAASALVITSLRTGRSFTGRSGIREQRQKRPMRRSRASR